MKRSVHLARQVLWSAFILQSKSTSSRAIAPTTAPSGSARVFCRCRQDSSVVCALFCAIASCNPGREQHEHSGRDDEAHPYLPPIIHSRIMPDWRGTGGAVLVLVVRFLPECPFNPNVLRKLPFELANEGRSTSVVGRTKP